MTLDAFILRLILISIPGYIGYKTFRTIWSVGKKQKVLRDWESIFGIIVMAVAGYLILGLFRESNMIKALVEAKIPIEPVELVLCTLIVVGLGIGSAFIANRKYVNRFFRWIGVTNHFGDEDLWTFIHTLDIDWVNVRDHKLDLIYKCNIAAFSDYGEQRELLLCEVDVYDNQNGRFLYKSDKMYICRDYYDLTIELLPKEEQDAGTKTDKQKANTRGHSKKGRSKQAASNTETKGHPGRAGNTYHKK